VDNTFFGDTVSSCSGYGIALLAANAQNNQIESETVTDCSKGIWLSNAGVGNALLSNAISSSGAWDVVCEGASASSRTGNACSTSSKACSGCTPGVCTTAACN